MFDISLITKELIAQANQFGLNEEEFKRFCNLIGRLPSYEELAVCGALWSEHCSYKNSIVWLKKLPKKGPSILAEAGEENAGLVDIGDGLACAFKIESHKFLVITCKILSFVSILQFNALIASSELPALII